MKHIKNLVLGIVMISFISNNAMNKPSSFKQKIYVQTSDGKVMTINRWQINEIKVLLVLLEHHKGSINQHNPLIASMLTSAQLDLLLKSLTAIADGKFDRFYNHLAEQDIDLLSQAQKDNKMLTNAQKALSVEGKLRYFINLAERMQAHIISDFCLAYTLPLDVAHAKFTTSLIANIKQMSTTTQFLPGHSQGITMALFSPDGSRLVSGSYGEKDNLIVWNMTKDKPTILHYLKGHPSYITAIAWSSDGKNIVSSCFGMNNNIILWDASTGKGQPLQGCPDMVNTLAFSHDNKLIAAGCSKEHENVIIWDIETKEIKKKFMANPYGVKKLLFHPSNSNILVSAGHQDEDNLLVCNLTNNTKVSLSGHAHAINDIAFNKEGNKLVSCSDGNSNLMWWDINTGKGILLQGQEGPINTVAFNRTGYEEKIISGGDGGICIWDLVTGENKILNNSRGIFIADFSKDGNKIISVNRYYTSPNTIYEVILWDVETGQSQQLISENIQIRCPLLSPDERKIIACCFRESNNLILISFLSEKEEQALKKCDFIQAHFLYRIFLALQYDLNIKIESPVAKNIFDSLPSEIKKLVERSLSGSVVSKKNKWNWLPFAKKK